MHKINHPNAVHYQEDVWKVDPREVCKGRPVAVAWFSPDCTHHSRARGSKPVKKEIRGLAWVIIRWAATVRPRVAMIENVEEFTSWCPVIYKLDEGGNKAFDRDGEPVMIPDPTKEGVTFKRFIARLENLGYRVEYRVLTASEYGAPTSRARLFIIARCDGLPIVWPEPTHGEGKQPMRTAAECIDFSIPTNSIFTRKKSLCENTLRRIAKGIQRFVIKSENPFYLPVNENGEIDHAAFVAKHFTGATGCRVDQPMPTILASGAQNQLVTANLIRHFGQSIGGHVLQPMPTITAGGMGKTGLVTSHIMKLYGTCNHGQSVNHPMPTITAGGTHLAEVRTMLRKFTQDTDNPTGVFRVGDDWYQIVDIGTRMFTPRELYNAQGFAPDYIIDPIVNGKRLTKTAQYRMVGNSVAPDVAEAIVKVNCTQEILFRKAA